MPYSISTAPKKISILYALISNSIFEQAFYFVDFFLLMFAHANIINFFHLSIKIDWICHNYIHNTSICYVRLSIALRIDTKELWLLGFIYLTGVFYACKFWRLTQSIGMSNYRINPLVFLSASPHCCS